jgi:hypothetical protein
MRLPRLSRDARGAGHTRGASPRRLTIGGCLSGAPPMTSWKRSRACDLTAWSEDADLLGPLVIDEILIRPLPTPIGNRVAQIGQTRSGVQRIVEAVTRIRTHFAQPVTVEEMAASVHMSASSFTSASKR